MSLVAVFLKGWSLIFPDATLQGMKLHEEIRDPLRGEASYGVYRLQLFRYSFIVKGPQ